MKICIDPGHGGWDPGAVGNGMRECDITLDIALELKIIAELQGFEVVMTRNSDVALTEFDPKLTHNQRVSRELQARCDVANKAKADLYVAIHVNAGGGTGTETYALPGGNAARCADNVQKRLIEACKWANRGVKTNQKFYVLVNTKMPAILSENGFIDTASDAEKLHSIAGRKGIAMAHLLGILDYFGMPYKEPIKPVPQPEAQVPDGRIEKACDLLQQAIDILKGGK